MKAYIIQPQYSLNNEEKEKLFNEELNLLDSCDDGADIIVLPEYFDVFVATKTDEEFIGMIEKYSPIIEKKVKETAKRCNAIVFANYGYKTDKGYRNTTHVFDRNGNEVGRYFKEHQLMPKGILITKNQTK